MNRRTVVSALFIKDLRQFWPLVALTALTLLAQGILVPQHSVGGGPDLAFDFLSLPAAIVPAIFLVRLVQEDFPASLRREWLTRPVGGLNLLIAKFLLAAFTILLPEILSTVVGAAREGMPVSEALLFATGGTWNFWIFGFGLLLATAVTETFVQAVGVAIIAFLLFIYTLPLRGHIPGNDNGLAVALGSFWVISAAITLVTVVGGIALLWFAYTQRRTVAARVALTATIALLAVAWSLPQDFVLAVQKAVAGDHPASERVRIDVAAGCFEANYARTADRARIPPANMRSGRKFVAFSTIARAQGLPAGWRMMVRDIQGRFTDSHGSALDQLDAPLILSNWSVSPDGAYEARHGWAMRRERYDEMSRRATDLRLDYGMSLLEPVHSGEIAIDGKRYRLPGLGLCTAVPRWENEVEVSCLKVGHQPQVITARMTGGKGEETAFFDPSFAPSPLQFSPGTLHRIFLRPVGPAAQPRVTITAYEARAYVERQVSVPGLIGGRVAACRPGQLR